ncbi:hypothetical protein CRUP_015152 [Coryphaenoides rupestris]|nr:hypothetical protein CRUP_015152 [Coryphaenoides rupestris]
MKNIRENCVPVHSQCAASVDHIKPCWYWDKRDLAHTPSQSEGLDPATEASHYDTLATGIIYFHRFYMFHSFKQFPRYVTGGCCLFLAGKVEETPKKCKDIIKTARSLLNDIQFAQFGDDPKEEVMVLERILLQTIKFDLQVEHPYQFLLRYAKQLKGDKNKVQKLVQMAWTFVNDSLCTMLSLQWEPEIIAVAVMYLAGRLCKFDIQEWTAKQSSRRWWEQFVQDVPMEVLEDICHQILDLYSQGKQQMPPGTSPVVASGPGSAALEKAASSSPAPPPQLQPQTQALPHPRPSSRPPRPPSWPRSPRRRPAPEAAEEGPELSGAKIPRLEPPPMPPMPAAQPPPGTGAMLLTHCKFTTFSANTAQAPPLVPAPQRARASSLQPTGRRQAPVGPAPAAPSPLPLGRRPPPAPPPSHAAATHQPPPLPHRPPPPPPHQPSQATYIMGIPTSSSYMSGEGFQSLQSLMTPDGSGGAGGGGGGYPAPSQAYPPPPLGYHGHAYPPSASAPPPPPPQAGASYHGPPPNAAYPPPPMPPPPYSHGYSMPPPPHGHMGMAHVIPGYGQGSAPPPPGMPPGMPPPPPGGMTRGAWMR